MDFYQKRNERFGIQGGKITSVDDFTEIYRARSAAFS